MSGAVDGLRTARSYCNPRKPSGVRPLEMLHECVPYVAIVGTLLFTGVGIPPIPEEVAIIAAGIASNQQEIIWWVAWPVCVLGVLSADLTLYWTGRLWGTAIFRWRLIQRILPDERRERLEEGFHRHGVKILLSGRLLPGFRTGVFLTAGSMRYPFIRFLLVDGLTAVLSVGLVFFGSYFLTESFTLLLGNVDQARSWLVVVVLLMLAGYLIAKYWRRPTISDATQDLP